MPVRRGNWMWYILSHGVENINSRGRKKRTPVMIAVLHGRLNVFNCLVEQGCDLSLLDNAKQNVLHYACKNRDIDVVNRIISLNVTDIDSRDEFGYTPILIAVHLWCKSIIELLVSNHCNMTTVTDDGETSLHLVCMGRSSRIKINTLKYIFSLNVIDIESKQYQGRTPVMYAVMYGFKHAVELFVSKHCNMKAVDRKSKTILHLACEHESSDMLKYILSLNVIDIESKDRDENTPLLTAVRYNVTHAVDILVSQHCNTNAVDTYGNTMLHVACISGSSYMLKHILSLNLIDIESKNLDERTPAMTAAKFNVKHAVETLASEHCNMSAVDYAGDTLLHAACLNGNSDMVKYLLSLGVFTGREQNKLGKTPDQVEPKRGRTIPNECKLN